MTLDIGLDLFPFLAGLIAALTCALLGNFLVLRRLSLMGDAISHSVLPGLVAAFVLAGTRSTGAMFLGAAAAGVATAVLVELIKKLGRVEPGAAMGVVFSVLFALGVLLIEQFARQIDLDAECVLHGQLEGLVWFGAPETIGGLFSAETLHALPHELRMQAGMLIGASLFVVLFFKELRLCAFDPGMATAQGINAGAMHFSLMIVVAAATVASFEAVGSILVIAMLICPAATARLLTDTLRTQIWLSLGIAALTATGGYASATILPSALGLPVDALSASGSMTLASGALLVVAILASPRYGLIARVLHRRRLARKVLTDDILGLLYRIEEAGDQPATTARLVELMPGRDVPRGVAYARSKGLLSAEGNAAVLTEAGRLRAAELIRRHRLWEHYLVEHAGLSSDHVHDAAEFLEHIGPTPPEGPAEDPHGRPIP